MFSHHDDEGEESCASAHHDEAVNKPRGPDDAIADSHDLQGLLQTKFLLQDDALDCHGHRINPGQYHEDGETAVQCQHEAGWSGGKKMKKQCDLNCVIVTMYQVHYREMDLE